MEKMLRVGELATLAGVSVKTVRYYERVGILPPPVRTAAGYRLYDAHAAVVLIRARQLAEFGIPLVRVRDLLDTNANSDVLGELLRARQRVDATFESLRRRRAALDALIDSDRADSAWPAVLDPLPKGLLPMMQAEIREVFTIPNIGRVAGAFIMEGTAERGMTIHLVRSENDLGPTTITDLRHFKSTIDRAEPGMDVGILMNRQDIEVGDLLIAS